MFMYRPYIRTFENYFELLGYDHNHFISSSNLATDQEHAFSSDQ